MGNGGKHRLSGLLRDEAGATAIEYALILAAIAGIITLVVISLGNKVKGLYSSADDQFPTP